MKIIRFDDAVKATIDRNGGEDYNILTYLNYAYGIFVIADDCVQDVYVYDSDTDSTAFVVEFGYSEHYEVHEFIYKLMKHRVPFSSCHELKSEQDETQHDEESECFYCSDGELPW